MNSAPEPSRGNGWIDGLIHWSVHHRLIVLTALLLVCGYGIYALHSASIDALPDLSENQVIVYADWPGRSPREVEDQITYPLSVHLQGMAGVRTIRASSMFGFSLITVVFQDKLDRYFIRDRVLERLNSLGTTLPTGVIPQLGPDATGLGWIYEYYLKVDPTRAPNGGYDLGQLRSIQDYALRYPLSAVPGVAEVASIGGFVRQYEVEVSSLKMADRHVKLDQVMSALSQSSLNVGGKTIDENGREFVVRGVGLIRDLEDIASIPVDQENDSNGRMEVRPVATPRVLLRDIAEIRIGGSYRRGMLDVDGHEVVGGIVVMRSGENARQVIADVKAKIAELSSALPAGLTLQPFYDRSDLIDRSIATLKITLWEEIILVTLVHILFLSHFRSILIVTVPLPASILIAFILMKERAIPSDLMSLMGLAISIGVVVDAGIVLTENVIRHCQQAEARKGGRRLSPGETLACTLQAARQVGRPTVFSMIIIVLAFIPVFALSGQEGKLFHPLAYTKTFALIGATLLAITVVPVLCTFLVRGPFRSESEHPLMRILLGIYEPLLGWALRYPFAVLAMAGLLLTGAFGLANGMGSEFMPALEEGSLLLMPTLVPGTSLTEAKRIVAWQDQVIRAYPEVASVAGKVGRADTATDPAPVEMIETTIQLKPHGLWRKGMTKPQIVADLTNELQQVPGYVPGFLMPIEARVLMLSTGIRASIGVKLFGDDLAALQDKALEVARVVSGIPGAVGVAPSRTQATPYLEIELQRDAMARFGLRASDVASLVEVGLGGTVAASTIHGRERWPIQLRLSQEDRHDIERWAGLMIATPDGRRITLGQVATIKRTFGPSEIGSENGRLMSFVQTNVDGRDLGGFMSELRTRIQREVKFPPGMMLEFSGQYEDEIHANRTLMLIIPAVLLIIFGVLTLTFRSVTEAAHVILAIPFALTGGILFQYLLGLKFSVAVWVGFIALFGTAIQTGILMVIYLDEAVTRRRAARGNAFDRDDLLAAVKEGARLRLRPKVMTVATTVGGLLPIFWSHRTGVEIMQPLAAPVIGGMVSSLVHILFVTPVIFFWLRERELRRSSRAKLH